MMRLFIAIPVSTEISDKLGEWASTSKEGLAFRKWTHPADYHITLQFLGDVSDGQMEDLKQHLSAVKAEPFQLQIGTAHYFGMSNAPRVLLSSIDGDSEKLHTLQRAVCTATSKLGFEPEKRAYKPHVTLARKYNGNVPFQENQLMTVPSGMSWSADHFVLMKTNIYASPMYENMGNFFFNK